MVRDNEIIGIFDIENTTISKHTRKFLTQAQKADEVITISDEMPKSFCLCRKNNRNIVYITPISAVTLKKRLGMIIDQ